jgi:hypothetical protein
MVNGKAVHDACTQAVKRKRKKYKGYPEIFHRNMFKNVLKKIFTLFTGERC